MFSLVKMLAVEASGIYAPNHVKLSSEKLLT